MFVALHPHVKSAFYLKLKSIKRETCKRGHSRAREVLGREGIHAKADDESNVCFHCGKPFKSRGGLEVHAHLNNGSRPYLFNRCFAGGTKGGAIARNAFSNHSWVKNKK